jgi:putative selenate reductase
VAELVPVPFPVLLRRARAEFDRQRAIYDLPARKFYRGAGAMAAPAAGLDLSVACAGTRAANPIGPAAGPHTQLAQNLALCWLGGARILELKTVQANDALTLSRPCIDMATLGYNTEWSQELRLADSLREYVKASMLIECLEAWNVLERGVGPSGFVFDASVGYDLAGLQSAPMTRWLDGIRHAATLVEALRAEIPREFAGLRDLPFRTCVSASVTLSTFHGAPAGDIERIGEYLIGELGFHTIIKLNPPMLGRDRVEEILHDRLGYRDIEVNPGCYERALGFDEAVGMIRRLQGVAARAGVDVGIKCGNTLEVVNHGGFLKEPVQYLSGQPLHALHAALVERWREAFGDALPLSFSAGIDAHNVADAVAAGLVPVTTCTDLLRAGGYTRLSRYLVHLEDRMRAAGAATIGEFVTRSAAEAGRGSVEPPSLVTTRALAAKALSDPRYRADHNRTPPRKLGTHLWMWDCLSCSKCVPACPNDAVFELDSEPFLAEVPTIAVCADGWHETGRTLYRAMKPTQIAIFADACNACGNCDVFCPEDGGPYLEKALIFGSEEAWTRAAPAPGFVLTRDAGRDVLRGRFDGGVRVITHAPGSDTADFESDGARLRVDWESHEVVSAAWRAPADAHAREAGSPNPEPRIPNPVRVDLAHYMTLRLLLDALMRPTRVHFVNAPHLEP